MAGGIGVNIDQLTNMYTDGLPNYKSAASNFSDGAATASSCQNFFLNGDLNEYLPSIDEMNMFIMLLSGESTVIDTGYTTFAGKIAYLLVTLSEIEGKIDLSDYKDLAAMIEQIKGMSEEQRNNFDANNLANYSNMVNQLNTLKETIEEAMKSMDYTEVLKKMGYTQEQIDEMIASLGGEGIDKDNFDKQRFASVLIFLASVVATRDIPSSLGDAYWTYTDNNLWGAGTILSGICSKYINQSYGGVIASLTIGTIIALTGAAEGESFDSVLSTFLEEGVAAACGAAVTTSCTSAILASSIAATGGVLATIGTGGLLLLAVGTGIAVTTVTGALFHSIFYYPGDIPKNFHHWDEAAQRKYIEDEMGIDLDLVDQVDKLIESGTINQEEASKLIKYCGDQDAIFSEENYGSPELVAFRYYMANKGMVDYQDDVTGLDSWCGAYGAEDYSEVLEYVELYKSVLGEASA